MLSLCLVFLFLHQRVDATIVLCILPKANEIDNGEDEADGHTNDVKRHERVVLAEERYLT